MHMRYRLVHADAARNDARPIACAGTRQDAFTCAEALSAGRVIAILDYADHESPDDVAYYRDGQRRQHV